MSRQYRVQLLAKRFSYHEQNSSVDAPDESHVCADQMHQGTHASEFVGARKISQNAQLESLPQRSRRGTCQRRTIGRRGEPRHRDGDSLENRSGRKHNRPRATIEERKSSRYNRAPQAADLPQAAAHRRKRPVQGRLRGPSCHPDFQGTR